MAKIDPLIALAIPTWGKVSINWSRAHRHLGGPLGSNMVELAPVVGKPIAEARNELMQAAIDNNCDFLFFLGDDVLPNPDAIIRLLQRMWDDPDKHLITGVYWTKHWPTQPYIWRGVQRGPYLDWKHGEFFEIDYAGCDCLMVRLTPEMKALGPEWFSTNYAWESGQKPGLLMTEDFYFYTKTRKAGMKLWCDTEVQCIHEDRNTGAQFALTTAMPQYEGAQEPDLPEAKTDEAPLVKVADIGCGIDSPYFGNAERCKIVRFDGNEEVEPDFRCDIRRLPAKDESYDVVHSRHVLEHFGRADVFPVLKEWARILRVGGEFRLSVPNILCAMKNILLMEEGVVEVSAYPWWQLYGRQDDFRDVHKNGFTPRRVKLIFERLGCFEDIEVTTDNGPDDDLNIFVKARKARHLDIFALVPEWGEIEKAEGIKVPGMSEVQDDSESSVPAPAKRNGRGVRKAREGVLAQSRNGRKEPVGATEEAR